MRRMNVVHIGPVESKGGMSEVIRALSFRDTEKWKFNTINSHSDNGIMNKLERWRVSRRDLKMMIKSSEIDIAHIHVTHSISWWRKYDLLRICKLNSIPVILHIHSGRFDAFCKSFFGITGYFVKKILKKYNPKVVLLENRWVGLTKEWILETPTVINNFSKIKVKKNKFKPNKKIKILMMARKSKGKGHNFAKDIVLSLKNIGREVELTITGIKSENIIHEENIIKKYWVTEEEKVKLLQVSDFLISPSEFEGSSMSVIEAMSNGIIPLVSPTSSETIGIAKLVTKLEDPEEWAKKINKLANEVEYNITLKEVEQRALVYDEKVILKKWDEIYLDVLRNSD